MKKTEVFAVNSGSYSDYRVNALFSSRKLAEEYMKTFPLGDPNEIEVFELDPPGVDLVHRGYSVWRVLMLEDGTTEEVERTANSYYDVEHAGISTIWKRSEAPFYKGKGTPDAMDSRVWAKTEKQAVKIANEKRVQMIANGEWK